MKIGDIYSTSDLTFVARTQNYVKKRSLVPTFCWV